MLVCFELLCLQRCSLLAIYTSRRSPKENFQLQLYQLSDERNGSDDYSQRWSSVIQKLSTVNNLLSRQSFNRKYDLIVEFQTVNALYCTVITELSFLKPTWNELLTIPMATKRKYSICKLRIVFNCCEQKRRLHSLVNPLIQQKEQIYRLSQQVFLEKQPSSELTNIENLYVIFLVH